MLAVDKSSGLLVGAGSIEPLQLVTIGPISCKSIRRKPRAEWLSLRPGSHEGYVDLGAFGGDPQDVDKQSVWQIKLAPPSVAHREAAPPPMPPDACRSASILSGDWKHLKADTVGRMTITDKADFKVKVRASIAPTAKRPRKNPVILPKTINRSISKCTLKRHIYYGRLPNIQDRFPAKMMRFDLVNHRLALPLRGRDPAGSFVRVVGAPSGAEPLRAFPPGVATSSRIRTGWTEQIELRDMNAIQMAHRPLLPATRNKTEPLSLHPNCRRSLRKSTL